MTETKGSSRARRWAIGSALSAAGVLAAPLAQADTVLLAESSHVSGTQSALYTLSAPSAGTLSVTLNNLDWPARLSNLSFALATASGVLTTLSEGGSTSYNLTGGGTYYALVTGTAQGRWNVGMFSLRVSFSGLGEPSPVPLPGALALLLSALAGVFGLRSKQTVTNAS